MGSKNERKDELTWNEVRKAERKLAKYSKTKEEEEFAQRGSRELRRKWELAVRRAGGPAQRMQRFDSVTGKPLWGGAINPGKQAFKPTPEPEAPDPQDAFDRWQWDRNFRKGHLVQEILGNYVNGEDPTAIQGKHKWGMLRYVTPEWMGFNSFLAFLVAQFAASPPAAKQRASILYLFYRCEYTDREIADELNEARRKELLTTEAVEKCRLKMVHRGDKLWADWINGKRAKGPTASEKMIRLFLENEPECDRERPTRFLSYSYPHVISAHDIITAYGQVVPKEIGTVITPDGFRNLAKQTFKNRVLKEVCNYAAVDADGQTMVDAREFIQEYGDSEVTKFDTEEKYFTWKGKQYHTPARIVPKRERMKDGNVPVVPASLLAEPVGPPAMMDISEEDREDALSSPFDTEQNDQHNGADDTRECGSPEARGTEEWLEVYFESEEGPSQYSENENEDDGYEDEYEDAA
jgi:hypothetical protein